MTVRKLLIKHETTERGKMTGQFEVGYNPAKLVILSGATWQPSDPPKQGKEVYSRQTVFHHVEPDTLTVSFLFDTYESASAGPLASTIDGFKQTDRGGARTIDQLEQPMPRQSVLDKTAQVQALARVWPNLGRPPVCLLTWGIHNIFRGVLTKATQTITFFMEDGTPVRASLDCTFSEVLEEQSGLASNAKVSLSKHLVRTGDTLMSIATMYYGDGGKWRLIAASNKIDNPLSLEPGLTLTIPPKG